jgi:CheY-like chemotaxis protein
MGNILHAEDSEDEAFLISSAFRKVGIAHVVITVRDGEEAVTYLCNKPRPDLVLLDLKMPRLSGFDVLAYIRGRPDLKDIPVIVFTASELAEDIAKARSMGALDYFVKTTEWLPVAAAMKSCFDRILSN